MRCAPLLFATILLASCGGSDYGPSGPGGGGGGGGGGGPVGSVAVGNGIEFVSRHNGSANPAVDTIAAGAAITWSWSGSLPHNVRSVGAPGFASSDIFTGTGTYVVTFATPGTYRYDCAVHGQAMSGTVVVTGETGAADVKQTVRDATDDTFGFGTAWDLIALTIARDADTVTVTLDLSRDIVSPISDDTTAMIGFVDLDVDQDATTGDVGVVDLFRLDGASTGLGVDYVLQLRRFDADSTILVTTPAGEIAGRVKPEFDGPRVTVRIPTEVLGGDDGFLNAAAIVGNLHAPTDFGPEQGHLTLGGTPAVTSTPAVASAATRRSAPTAHAWHWR